MVPAGRRSRTGHFSARGVAERLLPASPSRTHGRDCDDGCYPRPSERSERGKWDPGRSGRTSLKKRLFFRTRRRGVAERPAPSLSPSPDPGRLSSATPRLRVKNLSQPGNSSQIRAIAAASAVAPAGGSPYSPPPSGSSRTKTPVGLRAVYRPAALGCLRPSGREQVSERGAVWLAHQSGGLGVGGSNPLAPTISKDLAQIIEVP